MTSRIFHLQQILNNPSALIELDVITLTSDINYYEWHDSLTDFFEIYSTDLIKYCNTGKIALYMDESDADEPVLINALDNISRLIIKNSVAPRIRSHLNGHYKTGCEMYQYLKREYGTVRFRTAVELAYQLRLRPWKNQKGSRTQHYHDAVNHFDMAVANRIPYAAYRGVLYMAGLRAEGLLKQQIDGIISKFQMEYHDDWNKFTIPILTSIFDRIIEDFP